MPRAVRLVPLVCAVLLCMTSPARAARPACDGPFSRAAIARAAERDLFVRTADPDTTGFPGDSRDAVPSDTAEALASPNGAAGIPAPSGPLGEKWGEGARKPTDRAQGSDDLALIVGLTVAMEGALAGTTYATVRQKDGGYYWGGFMILNSIIVPALGGAEGTYSGGYHTVSLLACSAAFLYVGVRDIQAEKRGDVDRARMFRESFIGLNVACVLPALIEGGIRMVGGSR